MKTFNITAQIYSKNDPFKQNIFMNELITALCSEDAKTVFIKTYHDTHQIIKIYSIEETPKVSA